MYSRRLIIRHGFVSASFVLLYLLLNRPEVVVFSRIGFVAWYPAAGVAASLMLGISPWYAVVVCVSDALAGKVLYGEPVLSFGGTVDAIALAVIYGAAAYVLRGPLRIDLGLRRRRDVVRYVLVSTTAAVAASIVGVACLTADHSLAPGEFKRAMLGWLLGDVIGLVGIAPFLLVHVFPHVRKWLSPAPSELRLGAAASAGAPVTWSTLVEAGAQALTMIAVLWAIFGMKDSRYDHFYIAFVPIIWIAMRQGVRRVVSGLLVLNFGIVVAMHLFPPTAILFTKVALLMLVLSSVGLIVGSEVSERHRLALDLNEQTTFLESLIQNSPLGILVLDRQGRVELANSAFETLFQHDRRDLSSIAIAGRSAPQDQAAESAEFLPQILAGNAVHRTLLHCRSDGVKVHLALHGVPLVLKGEVRGAYLLYEDISQQIKANEAQRQHADALDRLVTELELRTKQMACLNEMGNLLECSGTVGEACAVARNFMQQLFPDALAGGLYLFKSSRNIVKAAARWGKPDALTPTFPPQACWSLRRGQPHWSEHRGNGVPCLHLAENSITTRLCVPLVAQGNTVGILHIEFQAVEPGGENVRESRQGLATSAASQIALSLASLQSLETLREQAIRDPLTRLFNRRFLEESLDRELQIAARRKQSVAILFVDLDHFKRFNDTFGHEAGDLVLQSLADLFRNFFRATDICCRYGGEEFAIILPESSSQDAGIRADVLRMEVKALRLKFKTETLGQISLSAGVAAFPEHGTNSLDLLRIADQCLYESKSRGRDVVTVALPQNA